MIGVMVNAVAVIIGSLIGLIFQKAIPEKITSAVMNALGLCTMTVGITGLFKGENQLVLIISMVLGTIVGSLLDLDALIEKIGKFAERKFSSGGKKISLAQGFVTASLLFCVGSMTITGSLTAGITGDNSILFTKSMLDFVAATMLTVSLGVGVMLASLFVLVAQGSIVLLSGLLAGVLEFSGGEIVCCGSVMIIALGLNMLGITKIKVANMVPALIFVPIVLSVFNLF